KLRGARITKVIKHRAGLRFPFPRTLSSITGAKVKSILRRAKYILIQLDNNQTLVIHLGMSGRLTLDKRNEKKKHDHLLFYFDNGQIAVLNDPRRFGMVDLCPTEALETHKLFRHLGAEPLEKTFNARYLAEKLRNK